MESSGIGGMLCMSCDTYSRVDTDTTPGISLGSVQDSPALHGC
jgi:hypothetical protein